MKNFMKVLSDDGYGAPYPDTPSRGVTRDVIKGRNPCMKNFMKVLSKEGYALHTLYVIKGRNPL